jgi:pyrimidine-nucleoside phosphorylase
MTPSIVELIERKRDRNQLTPDEIRWLIAAYTDGDVPDYQMAPMLMAIVLNGLDAAELAPWTEAMLQSGDVADLAHIPKLKIDKHSTGGVGDKISLPLAPMVAACGIAVPMMSGRGLAHTGGTLDKLESIPGFRTELDPAEFSAVLEKTGLVMAGQSPTMVPADRKIYALRDTTGTVPSIPLIASSIMSKKLAEDIDGLVLDVKVGRGAFMRTLEDARVLAETMVGIGRSHDTPVVAYLTSMNQPLGDEVGNANEMRESLDVLRGQGPADILELTLTLGAEMLLMGGAAPTHEDARTRLLATIEDGSALALFRDVTIEQGGDPAVIDDPSLLAVAKDEAVITAPRSGHVTVCDALAVGHSGVRLGAGRAAITDDIDHGVAITIHAKVGDEVAEGEALATIRYNDHDRFQNAAELLEGAWEIEDEAPAEEPLVIDVIR